MNFKLLSLLIFLSASNWIFAQTTEVDSTVSIIFEGQKKTKVSFLNDIVGQKKARQSLTQYVSTSTQNLKNIPGIGNATASIDTLNGGQVVRFKITEVKTLLPIVNFGGIKDNVWFQLGFSDINWMGKGHFLSAHYQNTDRRHAGQVYFRIPRFKNQKWGASMSLSRWASREPVFFNEGTVNYDYDNNSVALSAIRNFGLHRNLELGGNFFVEKYKKSASQFLETPPGPEDFQQPKLLSKIDYREVFLNYHFFYLDGYTWSLTLQNIYNTKDLTWFHTANFLGHKYVRIKDKINLAFRLKIGISSNDETPFAPFVVDSHVNLRGVGNRIDRGTAQAVFNAEYRQTLYESSNWAAQVVVFSDLGSWRNPGGKLEDIADPDQFRHFVGGGFRIIYQRIYGAILRIDYGVDVYDRNQRGFVLGLGQYF